MWNESSAGIALSALNDESATGLPKPAIVESVVPGSIGQELGFEPGDQLLIKAELAKFKLGTCKIKSQIYVDNNLITESEFLASIVNRYE